MSIITGKLQFKGAFQKKLQDNEKQVRQNIEVEEEKKQKQQFITKVEKKKDQKIITFDPEQGTGKILTSSKTVHGLNTKFMSELTKDDFLIIGNPQTKEIEERKIASVLSDKSALLYEQFSVNIINFSEFLYRKQDQIQQQEETLEEQFEKKYNSQVTKKIQKDKNNTTLEYRSKKGMWSYKTHKEDIKGDVTREKLLDLRSKKNRDKFCWI